MKAEINARGNGACPLCRSVERCRIRKALSDSVLAMSPSGEQSPLEIVVYACPRFAEKE